MNSMRIKYINKPLEGKPMLTPDQFDKPGADLDSMVGRGVRLTFGVGKFYKFRSGRYAVRIRAGCVTMGCRGFRTVYAYNKGDDHSWCLVYNRRGQFLADMRTQLYMCPSCKKRGLRP